jgi:hypothetical protein
MAFGTGLQPTRWPPNRAPSGLEGANGDPVAGLGGGAPGMTVHSGGVGEVANSQVTEDCGGQAYSVASPSVVGGMRGDRDKGRPLRV